MSILYMSHTDSQETAPVLAMVGTRSSPSPMFWYQSTVNSLSRSLNPSKNETNKSIALWTSRVPAVSLIECIDNMGLPTSTVRSPIFESIGPTVLPQGLKIFTIRFNKSFDSEKIELTYHFEQQILVPYRLFAEQVV